MKQHYDLGQRFKARYTQMGLITDTFHHHEVFARSTPKERTLMSAQSFMHGLFPPGSGHPEALPGGIQPVPIHSVHRESDHVLYAHKNCPKVKYLVKEFRKGEEWREMSEKTTELRANIAKVFGLETVQLKELTSINTIIQQEVRHEKLLHEGLTPELIQQVKDVYHWLAKNKFPNRDIGRLAGGHLPLAIHNLFQEHIETKRRPKFTLFSAHDGTILGLLAALGVTDFNPPEYATYWLFELLKNTETGEYFVHIVFNDKPMILPGCEEMCPFENFTAHIEDSYHHDWHDQCALPEGVAEEKGEPGEPDTHNMIPVTRVKRKSEDVCLEGSNDRMGWELLALGLAVGVFVSFLFSRLSNRKGKAD
eukprot:TRINITY_DN4541_c0_g1_i2.p1 TRINITY_DN4541_c0_g1~~TRINITY_DN4541_c0_g1_i2.p1  ORF type:complete len:365 (+),score=50.09 TRINITY_DN4541_c0_g1_i2:274-1368(+)